MAKSVKLKDGSYLDPAGIYDTNRKQTQEEINKTVHPWSSTQSYEYSHAAGQEYPALKIASYTKPFNEVYVVAELTGYQFPRGVIIPKGMSNELILDGENNVIVMEAKDTGDVYINFIKLATQRTISIKMLYR